MNDNHGNPARLKDRHDQPDLVERIAGQAARDMPEPPPLSANTLARIAMRIEERTSKPRMLRLGPVLVAGSVLLGVVTVASAARMELLPRWMAKLVGIERRPASTESTPRVGKTPPAKKGSGHPAVPPTVAPAPVQPAPLPATAPAPAPQGPVTGSTLAPAQAPRAAESANRNNSVDGAASPRRLAMLEAKAPQRLAERPAKPEPTVTEVGSGRRLNREETAPLATKPSAIDRGLAPATPFPPVLPSMQPRPTAAETKAANVDSPSERPAPPSLPDPAPVQPLPTPTPNPPAPGHSPAARHLKDVVHALRVEHAPQTALDLLERHARELAGNAFAEEALLLRVEAMLALKRQPEALRLLDGMSLANTASSSVLLVTRGQLRANANRCAEAIADFDLALARALRPSKQALLGRAQCKQKLGDPQSAQSDLDRLHREFP